MARLTTPVMDPGDFFVVATNGLVARLIRWFTGSWANHAGIYVGAGHIVECNPRGVQVSRLDRYEGCHIAWSSYSPGAETVSEVLGAVAAMEGIPYGYLDLLAIVLHSWGVRVWAEHRLNRGDRLICSQMVARAYRSAGLLLVPGTPDNYVTPGDLARLLEGGKPPWTTP